MVRDGTVSGDMYGERIYHDSVTFSQGVGYPNGEGNVWYVDGTNGTTGGNGKSWGNAWSTIQLAVTAASAGDTIFVTAKALTDFTGDPTSYAETIIIPNATSNLSIIGVSRGKTQGGLPQVKIGTGSTVMLTIRAPGCLIANMGFNGAGSTGGGILLDDDYATKAAFGTSIINCHFKNCKRHATDGTKGGAINWTSAGNAWQVLISGNTFYRCITDICLIGTSNTAPQDVIIENNTFSNSPASTDVNIYSGGSGFSGGLVIRNNVFGALPAIGSGSVGLYTLLNITGTSSAGMFVDNVFGALGTTAGWGDGKAAADIADGIWTARNYSAAGLIVREAT